MRFSVFLCKVLTSGNLFILLPPPKSGPPLTPNAHCPVGFLGRAEDAGGWAPFNDPKQGNALLGALDLSFLAAYASALGDGMGVGGWMGSQGRACVHRPSTAQCMGQVTGMRCASMAWGVGSEPPLLRLPAQSACLVLGTLETAWTCDTSSPVGWSARAWCNCGCRGSLCASEAAGTGWRKPCMPDPAPLPSMPTGGMIGSGTCVILMGAAYFLNIHTLGYFIAVQIVGGEPA